ncbi:MAG: hypothetical protein JWM74_839 [Myxococcaceae bacterium]|nr:hypothetical protein [Myxococcaceae bacterium]
MRRSFFILAGALAAVATYATEQEAQACGGCFAPPENNTVVTDHRMILSISPQQTTLYDQIRYQGSPSSFAWVLPINGAATVGLSADVVFSTLDQQTAIQVVAPPINCPAPPSDCGRGGFGAAPSNDSTSADAGVGGVTVTKQETVGPYETVQLKVDATTPDALNTWLNDHGYAIPPDVQTIINQYVAEKYQFLAMKLVPGATVQAMRPVRITTLGASPVLPLRMVTAGTGATVGVSLWVIGDGRWEPTNFPTFHIETSELVWDWTKGASNFKDLRAEKAAPLNGRGWELETSTSTTKQQVANVIQYSGQTYLPDGGTQQAYDPVTDSNGNVTKTAKQVEQEDMDTLFAGIASNARVTRFRSDLAHASLQEDLNLGATADQSEVDRIRNVTREANQPQCPVYDGCNQVGIAPRDDARAQTDANNGNGESFACSTGGHNADGVTLFGAAGFFGIALLRSRKKRAVEQ